MLKLKYLLIALVSIIFLLFFIRLINPREIDDVSPEISCPELEIYNPDILWIIPLYNKKPMSENSEWCNYILALNRTIGLHGVTHEYQEFGKDLNQTYLDEGIEIFEDCFGFAPILFKPPQLKIIKENKKLIKENKMKLKGTINQVLHKVYHCSDTGKVSNKFVDIF